MTLACVICWQPILPAERHVVFDGGRGQGEHIACLPSTNLRTAASHAVRSPLPRGGVASQGRRVHTPRALRSFSLSGRSARVSSDGSGR